MAHYNHQPADTLAFSTQHLVQCYGYWMTYEWLRKNGYRIGYCLWLLWVANRYIAFTKMP